MNIKNQTDRQKLSKSGLYGYKVPEQEEKNGKYFCRCTIPFLISWFDGCMAFCLRCNCDHYH